MNFEIKLKKIANEIKDLPKQDKENIIMFADNREWGVAWDSLCNQIYEYDVPISKEQFEDIKKMGQDMNMNPSNWEMLKELIK